MCTFFGIFYIPIIFLAFGRWRAYRQSGNLMIRSVADRVDLLDSVDVFYRYKTILVLDFQLTVWYMDPGP